MSDAALPHSAHPGSLSPSRDIDTHTYRVLRELPRAGLPAVGDTFAAWAWGEQFAQIFGCGVATNAEIAEWLADGMIEAVR